MTTFLLYQTLLENRVLTFSRDIWVHYAADYFNVEHVTCLLSGTHSQEGSESIHSRCGVSLYLLNCHKLQAKKMKWGKQE